MVVNRRRRRNKNEENAKRKRVVVPDVLGERARESGRAVTHEEYSCGRRAMIFATKKKKFLRFFYFCEESSLSFFLSFFFFLSLSRASDDVCSCVSVCVLQRVINTNKGGHACTTLLGA